MFKNCYGKYAIAAVNVFTMEQVLALFRSGEKANAPFIIQMTPVARNYAGSGMLLSMIESAARMYPKAVFAIHLDHGNKVHAFDAIESRKYDSVMIDASHDSFDDNIRKTRNVVHKAHQQEIVVEAELGVLSGVEDDLIVDEKNASYTQPSEVVTFVKETGCDSLAVAIGTSHGVYKFSGKQGIQFDILRAIQERLPYYPIVLHGGSAVNHDEISRINLSGGALKEGAVGVHPNDIVRSINYGVCKINIATDTSLLWARVHREFFKGSPELFDPIIPGGVYMKAYERFMIDKFELLGALGKVTTLKSN